MANLEVHTQNFAATPAVRRVSRTRDVSHGCHLVQFGQWIGDFRGNTVFFTATQQVDVAGLGGFAKTILSDERACSAPFAVRHRLSEVRLDRKRIGAKVRLPE